MGHSNKRLVERLTNIAFAEAFWGAPVLTGYLANTVYKELNSNEGKVGAAASYAVDVELGTAPHEIRPANGRLLAFRVAGKMVFTPVVHHPGTKANPFLRRAADKARSKFDSTFAELWLDLVGG